MCTSCPPFSRRAFFGGALTLPLWHGGRGAGLVEPCLRLPVPGVAVTLDACPGHFDERIANTLIACNIPATIFVTETWMRWNPDGLALLKSRPDLFKLENHGARHIPPVLGTVPIYGIAPAGTLDAIRAEVLDGAAAITAATGKRPTWYRAAAGIYSPAAIPAIEAMGFKIAGYSLNSDEGASLPARTVAARITAAKNGDVIEGHINQPKRDSGAGIAAGLKALHAAGTSFVRLDQLPTSIDVTV
ncbi:polysaccharide deacetylase family protein [Acidocella aromatica]|uniref:Chitooligosaccharide deacetylase n=1 Tax=Acidocella aromatica TaxID=1303579 RepID=A0A840V8E3_9PROT|nr:polysaccharide deacetylase family protein [Acidocella aromatica]MBB5372016.1 peptidoglycan/xylan/chitin deacetylase (PgdA/CDA1 family) [Acidocella aromatica]